MSIRKIQVSVREDESLKASYSRQEKIANDWPKHWEWLVEEYKKLQEDMAKLNKTTTFTIPNTTFDKIVSYKGRHLGKRPLTTSGDIGWISNNPEFKLEIFGPDIIAEPIPKEYKSQKL